ncbi:hypothetical protein, conserved [Leishmania donovani]|uniref:Uncharacterized protein n=1 Tax=Leishmania donovani TaxID=5661 RepID=E9B7U6_LEIDO|nr:hypothetical protein, conserved [Leishmania donovani]CBZ31319.1 hypothetical protein, conserved [Leishmania donovani]
MQVLSEATPMTNGEVYALLRRRRDERNAARHPPFGLQPVLADSHQRVVVATGAAAATAVAPSAAASASAISRAASVMSHSSVGQHSGSKAAPAGAIESAASAATASTASILASPSSVHLVVLLTEVTMLNYIANHSSLLLESARPTPAGVRARTCTPRDVYGPTSVYSRVVGSEGRSGAAVGASATAADSLLDAEFVSSCYAKLASHRPGTRGHVHAVEELLEHFEEAGRARERFYAAGVRRAVQQLWRRRLWVPAEGPCPPPSPPLATTAPSLSNGSALVKAEPVAEEDVDGTAEAVQRSSQDKVAMQSGAGETNSDAEGAQPTNASHLVTPLLLEPTPLWGPAARNGGGKGSADGGAATTSTAHSPLSYHAQLQLQQASRSLLSEAEVLQLVVGRPQRALDVYRLLDDVDGRLQYREEAVNAFVEAVTGVFAE